MFSGIQKLIELRKRYYYIGAAFMELLPLERGLFKEDIGNENETN